MNIQVGMRERESELNAVREYLKDNLHQLDCGLFFTRNIIGDPMELTLNGKYIMMWTCWGCGYVEVFGLDSDEQSKLIDWYDQLVIDYKTKE
jgi:hypothetical protein